MWPRNAVLVLDYLLDDAMRHALELVHQALRAPMKRMGHHVVHLLTQGPGALLLWYRKIYVVESAFRREPLPLNAMVVGPLKRADEIGFQQSFKLIILLLVFRRELFIRDGLRSGFLILSSSHCCGGRL